MNERKAVVLAESTGAPSTCDLKKESLVYARNGAVAPLLVGDHDAVAATATSAVAAAAEARSSLRVSTARSSPRGLDWLRAGVSTRQWRQRAAKAGPFEHRGVGTRSTR